MLHPALAQALVTAHLEDLQRAAARRHTIRLVSICRRRPLGAASGIDRASSEARRNLSGEEEIRWRTTTSATTTSTVS